MNALITFGCSWTAGKFSWYNSDISFEDQEPKDVRVLTKSYKGKVTITPEELNEYKTKENEYCFRTILSKRYDYVNINFARTATSNSSQFREAEEYFNKNDYKKYDDVIVLWGLTSTSRIEFWKREQKKYHTYFLTHDKDLENIIRKYNYDHDVEVKRLSTRIEHWDNYFKMIGIKNYWFDTFNHNDYEYKSPNMIMSDENPRDLSSLLCKKEGLLFNDECTHLSKWNSNCNKPGFTIDSDDYQTKKNRVKFLTGKKLVNPISFHPNRQGHILLADILDKFVNFCYYK